MSQTLTDLAAQLEARIKELRKAGDLDALLATAREAAREIEQRIDRADWNDAQRSALMAVQRLAYNAAADCWPGWSVPSEPSHQRRLIAARELALHSSELVERLGLPPRRKGTGIWLVGAFDLAIGKYAEASSNFTDAREHYATAGAPDLVLLMDGYLAIVQQVGRDGASVDGTGLDQVCARISAGDFKEGPAWIAQLRTAQEAFARGVRQDG